MPRYSHFLLFLALCLGSLEAREAVAQEGSEASRTGSMAILIRNPDTEAGQPPFALADQFGKVQRLVEPSPRVSLDRFVGQRVRIKHDTGRTLLASQLELPSSLSSAVASKTEPSSEPQPLREVSPAQFIPPRRVTRLDEADTPVESLIQANGRTYRVIPVQLEGEGESVGAEPIDLDSIIANETLPTPSRRLDPIPLDTDTTSTHRFETIEPVHTGHDPNCPHCNQHGSSGRVIHEGPTVSSHGDDCPQCRAKAAPQVNLCKTCGRGPGWCGPSCSPASRRGFYGRAEYLLWWFNGFDTPPLAVTNDQGNAPILGVPGTRTLYGGELLDGARSGMRYTLGFWLDDDRDFGIEADWLWFETETDVFRMNAPAGSTAFGRPFYNVAPIDPQDNVLPPANDVQLGNVTITARSRFQTGGIRLRTGICCREIGGCAPSACGCSDCVGGGGLLNLGSRGGPRAISRIDFIGGYRYAELEEQLLFQEDIAQAGTTLVGTDLFEVDNDFHGVDLGFIYEWQSRRWGLELTSKIALGQTKQQISINGFNTVGATGIADVTTPGLLYTQTSNIGVYENNRFRVLPELSARLSYRVTPRLRLNAAYSVLYWANVVRPGDQIDFSVDGRLASPATIVAGPYTHPRLDLEESSLWAHGFNFGLDYNY